MRLGRRLSSGIAEDPAPQDATAPSEPIDPAVAVEHPEARREHVEHTADR